MAPTVKEAEEEKQEEPALEDVEIGEVDDAEAEKHHDGINANETITDEREDAAEEEENGSKKKKKYTMKVAADAPWKDRMWEGAYVPTTGTTRNRCCLLNSQHQFCFRLFHSLSLFIHIVAYIVLQSSQRFGLWGLWRLEVHRRTWPFLGIILLINEIG